MNNTVLSDLSYGLYIIGAKDDERNVGCVVNSLSQATSKPVTLTVCINKNNYTNVCIKKTKEFAVSIISEKVKEHLLGIFGFRSSKDNDKFFGIPYDLTPSGLPYIKEGVTGYIQCKVINLVDNYTHTIFIAEAQEAEILSQEPPMTYAYYRNVIKGKTPKNASTYKAETENADHTKGSQICCICGYEFTGGKEMFDKLPEEYRCPICKAPKNAFIFK